MEINKVKTGNNLVIMLSGRLDANTAPELEKEIQDLDGVEKLLFDFKNLEYISSSGLRVLLVCQKKMSAYGGITIKNANEDIKDIFDVTGFYDIITII